MHFLQALNSLVLLSVLHVSANPICSDCVNYTALDGDYVNGSAIMNTDPLAPFETPMMTVFNTTSSEAWTFDATSQNGSAGIVIFFSRGTVVGRLGSQRGMIAVAWPNGTRHMESAFVEQSTVSVCAKKATGTWTNSSGVLTWAFDISNDHKYTVVSINSPTVKGTFKLKSRTPALYPGGLTYPNSNATLWYAPAVYWQSVVPVGDVEVDLKIRGTPFVMSGVGGHDKNWETHPWSVFSSTLAQGRSIVGPYEFSFWRMTSFIDGRDYISATLMKDGEVIFRTSNAAQSDTETYASFTLDNTGSLRLSPAPGSAIPLPSLNTGYILSLVSPKTLEHWTFHVDFSRTVFWFPASKLVSIGQYVGNVTGGFQDQKQYKGVVSGGYQELVQ